MDKSQSQAGLYILVEGVVRDKYWYLFRACKYPEPSLSFGFTMGFPCHVSSDCPVL